MLAFSKSLPLALGNSLDFPLAKALVDFTKFTAFLTDNYTAVYIIDFTCIMLSRLQC